MMMDEVLAEALPWLIWSVGFAIMYVLADIADAAKGDEDA